jgi:putative methyltransferase (TIGR04325 family)
MNRKKQFAWKIPGLRRVNSIITRLKKRYCRGVFRSFQDALDAIPPGNQIGYDIPDISQIHIHQFEDEDIRPSDYATLYWLGHLLNETSCLMDFGGNQGWSFYAFQRYLKFPQPFRWLVCDVPAVVNAGRVLAQQRKAKALGFTTEFSEANGCDVLLTSGTLQVVEQELVTLLSPLKKKPRHLLINRVPLTDRKTYYTVMNIGPSRCPYRIANRTDFISSLQRLGYSLIDSWRCPESGCRILLHPKRAVRPYSGMYLRLDSAQL